MNDPRQHGVRFRSEFDAWWPDYDHAPETCFRFVQRGLADMDIATRLCRQRRVCVQAGAHAGFWPRRLAGLFRQVYAFECERALFDCATRNLRRWRIKNVVLSDKALGRECGKSQMVPHRSAGSWSLDELNGTVPVNVTTIDALELASCDAIFLDVEGSETEALAGAAKTIEKFRPMLHVEQLSQYQAAIQVHMTAIGYRIVANVRKDAIYRPRERF
jgi:FkbM family methyltransferase